MNTKHSTNKIKAISLLVAAALICGSLLTMGFGPLGVVTIKVTSTNDLLANDGLCTLREAIIAANTNTPSGGKKGECRAGQSSKQDIITLTNGATYSLTLGSTPDEDAAQDGDLDIWDNTATTDLIIGVERGGKATISQDAAVDERVLHILGATVKMEGLILTGGNTPNDGGGIAVHGGALTLDKTEVSGNAAAWWGGGISNEGTLKLDRSTVSGNTASEGGGGIANGGMLKLEASTISGNSAQFGGGVWNNRDGELKMARTTLADNFARAGTGGGLQNDGTVTVAGSTFSGNSARRSGEAAACGMGAHWR
jgi:CSLREA domain-containing protein